MSSLNTDSKIRAITMVSAAVLGLGAIIIGFLIIGSIIKIPGMTGGFGTVLVQPYGGCALIIPAYLLCISFILINPDIKLMHILIVCAAALPVVTFLTGYAFIRNFDSWVNRIPFFASVQKMGLSFILFFVLVFECVLLWVAVLQFYEPISKWFGHTIKIPFSSQGSLTFTPTQIILEDSDIPEFKTPPADPVKVKRIFDELHLPREKVLKTPESFRSIELEEPDPVYSIPVEILDEHTEFFSYELDDATKPAAEHLLKVLKEFNIETHLTSVRKGPAHTLFEIQPMPGITFSQILNLQEDLAFHFSVPHVRVALLFSGKDSVGIEIPNEQCAPVPFRNIIAENFQRETRGEKIPIFIGKGLSGKIHGFDLSRLPHLLIAGSAGTGQAKCLHAALLSMLYCCHPADFKLLLIDTIEGNLWQYNGIPHLLTPVITDKIRALSALDYCARETGRRHSVLKSSGARDIVQYRKQMPEKIAVADPMPYIVVVINEFADIALGHPQFESLLTAVSAQSGQVGIHCILSTSRPSVEYITPELKKVISGRIALTTASPAESVTILGVQGCEQLLGRGDMLYLDQFTTFPVRVHCTSIAEHEITGVIEYAKRYGQPEYRDDQIFTK